MRRAARLPCAILPIKSSWHREIPQEIFKTTVWAWKWHKNPLNEHLRRDGIFWWNSLARKYSRTSILPHGTNVTLRPSVTNINSLKVDTLKNLNPICARKIARSIERAIRLFDCDSRRAWNWTNALRSGAQVEWDSGQRGGECSGYAMRALPLPGENASAARPTTVCENYCCHLPLALFLAAGVPVHVRARVLVWVHQRCDAPQRCMMDDANLGARIMAASGGLEALLNTTENFITVPRHEFSWN